MSSQKLKRQSLKKSKDDIVFLFDTNFFNMKNFQKGKKVTYKAAEDDEVQEYDFIIKGMANVKVVDRIGDFIRPSAYEKSMSIWKLNPVLRFNHADGSLIGHCLETEIQDDGLYIEAAIGDWTTPNGTDCKQIRKMIEHGSLKALSIMGRTMDFDEIEKEDPDGNLQYIWDIKEFDLIEISVVEIPMNQLSLFEKKGMTKEMAIKQALIEIAEKLKKNYLQREDNLKQSIKRKVNTMSKTIIKTKKKQKAKSVDAEVPEEEIITATVTDAEAPETKQDEEEDTTEDTNEETSEEETSEDDSEKESEPESETEEEPKEETETTDDDDLMKNLDLIVEFVQNVDAKMGDFSTALTDIDTRLKSLEQGGDNEETENEESSEEDEDLSEDEPKSAVLPTRTITSVEIQKSVLVESLTPVIKSIVADLVKKEMALLKVANMKPLVGKLKSKLSVPGKSEAKEAPKDLVSVITEGLNSIVGDRQ